jgi:hypothetical protein
MLPWRLGAEFFYGRRSSLRLPGNVAPAWGDNKPISGMAHVYGPAIQILPGAQAQEFRSAYLIIYPAALSPCGCI